MPLCVHLTPRGYGVLRLHDCFAVRNSHFAQDDKTVRERLDRSGLGGFGARAPLLSQLAVKLLSGESGTSPEKIQ